jgi:hypothetical protein
VRPGRIRKHSIVTSLRRPISYIHLTNYFVTMEVLISRYRWIEGKSNGISWRRWRRGRIPAVGLTHIDVFTVNRIEQHTVLDGSAASGRDQWRPVSASHPSFDAFDRACCRR